MVKENIFTKMETYMKDNFLMDLDMEKVYFIKLMEVNIKENGNIINDMENSNL
jgi:hypothetical protein